ncbi:alpha/beta fold hydrolase [Streptomyces sp. NPDC090445]|uniref:alpha/beta fold hydrolase n=1 Tax=Streptomyces sp. NPDC090445 TaxID=3365963 RepID=UPI003803E108
MPAEHVRQAGLRGARHPGLSSGPVPVEAGAGGPVPGVQERIGGRPDSRPAPFPPREAAVRFLGGGNDRVGAGRADGPEERDGGRWPRFDRDVTVGSLAGIAQRSHLDDWRKASCPTLLVLGQNGILLPAREVADMRAPRPGTTAVSVPGTGRDVHLERPDTLHSLLSGFLRSVEH